ncbi:pyridoxamine 5'-phosphate oxidase family protein [Palleronia rufa]|uniref:FAD-binding oxidoreductase n=1 Tax=Palleronia rufa TaxID=1530186 RepID=UPI00055D2BC1|nr:pyridoxamine 5'-phosphate oxidase family protein [Palleronia rufa]
MAGPDTGPFHAGELAVQARAGVGDMSHVAGFVRDHLPDQHRAFHEALPFLVLAARDDVGRVWATILEGPDGFVSVPDPTRMEIAACPGPDDPLAGMLRDGATVGLLGVDLATRRRNRINGRVVNDVTGLTVAVDQTFGNCPQYIWPRPVERASASPAPATHGGALDAAQAARLRAADTFFIATGTRGDGADAGMDASHRGGPPGFVTVSRDGASLRVPDYAGNDFFNTLGNLECDPHAGLLFVDFETGGLLHVTGRATVDWTPDPATGARRHVDVSVEAVIDRLGALSLRWRAADAAVRRLRLVEKTRESDDVTSFTFAAPDGAALPDAAPGQHLPILHMPGAPPLERSYSLSGPQGTGLWRISVKRDPTGTVSRLLHDSVEVGAVVEATAPAGSFGPGRDDVPLVLVSAGIGITPMLAHLHCAAATPDRPVWFVHGARDRAHHPFAAEVEAVVARHGHLQARTAYSAACPDAAGRRGNDWTGRLDAQRVLDAVGTTQAEFLLCGPPAFVAAMREGLMAAGVAARAVHEEMF